MNLIDNFKTPCVVIIRDETPDGMGGTTTMWQDAGEIDIAFKLNTSVGGDRDTVIADGQFASSVFTITMDTGVGLTFGDYIRRVSDNHYFRVVSYPDEKQTPAQMTVQFKEATAIRVEAPEAL